MMKSLKRQSPMILVQENKIVGTIPHYQKKFLYIHIDGLCKMYILYKNNNVLPSVKDDIFEVYTEKTLGMLFANIVEKNTFIGFTRDCEIGEKRIYYYNNQKNQIDTILYKKNPLIYLIKNKTLDNIQYDKNGIIFLECHSIFNAKKINYKKYKDGEIFYLKDFEIKEDIEKNNRNYEITSIYIPIANIKEIFKICKKETSEKISTYLIQEEKLVEDNKQHTIYIDPIKYNSKTNKIEYIEDLNTYNFSINSNNIDNIRRGLIKTMLDKVFIPLSIDEHTNIQSTLEHIHSQKLDSIRSSLEYNPEFGIDLHE